MRQIHVPTFPNALIINQNIIVLGHDECDLLKQNEMVKD
jgi:hypothetical protein